VGAFLALIDAALGAFENFETTLYFSGVAFTSLGYGDVVLHGSLRLVAPLQAANGLMISGFLRLSSSQVSSTPSRSGLRPIGIARGSSGGLRTWNYAHEPN
jgi:hypothetical protein